MKAYILKDSDFEVLLTQIDRDPRWGWRGGSSSVPTKEKEKMHEEVHQWFNHIVREWIEAVKK